MSLIRRSLELRQSQLQKQHQRPLLQRQRRKKQVADNDQPKETADTWPGILDEIEIKVVPVEYINSVEIQFTDGNSWSIAIDKSEVQDSEQAAEELEESLESLFDEYEDVIEGVNFILDVEKVKEDITERTKSFMKKKK